VIMSGEFKFKVDHKKFLGRLSVGSGGREIFFALLKYSEPEEMQRDWNSKRRVNFCERHGVKGTGSSLLLTVVL